MEVLFLFSRGCSYFTQRKTRDIGRFPYFSLLQLLQEVESGELLLELLSHMTNLQIAGTQVRVVLNV